MRIKILLGLTALLAICSPSSSQNYNREKQSWVNYIIRMYNNAPFEGVKAVDDATSQYLIVVLSLDPTKYGNNESTMGRVAAVKAQSQASRFFNGSDVTTDIIIKTSEEEEDASTEIIESIKEHSAGMVKSLELLTTFIPDNAPERKIYLFSTPINKSK